MGTDAWRKNKCHSSGRQRRKNCFCLYQKTGSVRYHIAQKHKQLTTYSLFLQDVDGLIEGSSVRMMGVPIGYVKDINIIQDQVYVKFVLTNEDIKLPQGVIATVEFNGMAGSKSLEIYPPTDISIAGGKLIEVKRTSRLGAALGLFDDMFAKFDSIIVRCNYFSGKLEQIMPTTPDRVEQSTKIDAEKSLGQLNNLIDNLNKKRLDFMNQVKPKQKNLINKF